MFHRGKPRGKQTKDIPSPIRITNLVLANLMHFKLPHLTLSLHRHHGGCGPLCDHDGALTLPVLLGEPRYIPRDLLDIMRRQIVCIGITAGFGLVANEIIPIRGRLIQLLCEELRDKWRAEAQDENLIFGRGFLGQR